MEDFICIIYIPNRELITTRKKPCIVKCTLKIVIKADIDLDEYM